MSNLIDISYIINPSKRSYLSRKNVYQNGAQWMATDIVELISTSCTLLLLAYLPFRIQKLRKASTQFGSGWKVLPQVIIGVLSIVLLLCLGVLYKRSTKFDIGLATSLLVTLIAAPGLSILIIFEQRKSTIPSDLATIYLLASILCDVLLLTIPFGISTDPQHAAPILTRAVAFLAILVIENWNRRPVNPILYQGYKSILVGHDLPPLDDLLSPNTARKRILRAWDQRSKPETKWALPYALYRSIRRPFLRAVLPRLFLTVFRYSQPDLIRNSIQYVTTSSSSDSRPIGYWIVVAAIIIYGGLAISTAIYQHQLNRLKLLTKSALTGLIHQKAMETPSMSYDNGEVVALMSSDVDGLDGITEMFHETWAQTLEVAVGMCLLAREVGWFWPLPLFLIFLSSRVSRYVAQNLQSRQKNWNLATQTRIGATSSMISSMKAVKMLGLQRYLSNQIQNLRAEELEAASKVRWMTVYYNASANALGIFSPAITLVCFTAVIAIKGQRLEAETAFTTMAVLSMVTHPANMVMTFVPRAIAAFAGFERIQHYLLKPSLKDQRQLLPRTALANSASNQEPTPVIMMQQVSIGDKQSILKDINIKIPYSSLTIISGPVGCGKSLLLRTMLGEVMPSQGTIMVASRRIAYCSQKAWLPSGTLQEVIVSNNENYDTHWYHEVVAACCLNYDLENLPEADETQVGSRGANLSGGQRQRVALARALFARNEIILLDDIFSALDGETERKVFENLFGSNGVLKRLKATVVLVSNSTQYYPAANNIVVLGDLGIKAQGGLQKMKMKTGSTEKFGPRDWTQKGDSALAKNFDKLNAQLRASDEAAVDLARQTGDTSLYGYYTHFVGLTNLLLVAVCTASYSAFIIIPQYWLKLWTDSGSNNTVFYITGFGIISFISWISTSGTVWATQIRLAPQSGVRLHRHLLEIITCAPLSYFSKTDNGSILNRFSQDMQLIDKQLPTALSNLSTQIFKLLAQTIVLFIVQMWLVLSLPACVAVVYIVQKVYLRTSRQLRFLELESRAAVFSSILETVEGLETIRAFGWRQETIQRNIRSVESSQRPESLLLTLQRWLNLVLDLLVAAMGVSIISIAVAWRGNISGGQVGVALNIMLVANTTLLRLVESWTNIEVSLGAISRLRLLEQKTPSENKLGESFDSPSNWPSRGGVRLTDVTTSYHPGAVALREVNLCIDPGQKVIVCGRTGSGKSSLLLTLLQMLELQTGSIELDGLDISQISRNTIRERCFVVDPEGLESDTVLIHALKETGLQSHFDGERSEEILSSQTNNTSSSESTSFLDVEISQLPALSEGQSQIFALTRALVKAKSLRNAGLRPIILLDEVTSSVDLAKESFIHKVIDEEFTKNGHTVIIVAHRLNALMDQANARSEKDIVVWINDGRVQEVITNVTPMILKEISQ
ncbi:putative ABC transporter [Xylogone sp. PMI_703]|nr:putative ABC transporter [Xylogone sp. PMI_703]